MRIGRLAEENRRTQGPERRAWYRRHSPRHLPSVAALVAAALAARAPAAPGAAIVLGAGACTEVPLERLARACSSVTLVDLDEPGMQRARRELPAALRARVRVVAADVSGGVSPALAALLRAQPWADLRALGAGSALAAAASCLERVAVPDPPTLAGIDARPCGLVLSTLVLTQLFSLPLLDALDTLTALGLAVDAPEADPRYRAAAHTFRRRVALAHLDLLAALLAPGGAAALITDETGYLLPPTGAAAAPREALPLLPPDLLDLPAELAARFTLAGPPRRWEWLVDAPAATRPGRAYDAVGAVLRPRAAAQAR